MKVKARLRVKVRALNRVVSRCKVTCAYCLNLVQSFVVIAFSSPHLELNFLTLSLILAAQINSG